MTTDLARMFRDVYTLKQTPRTGWLDRGLQQDETESVAEHSFLTAVISWVVACDDASLNETRVLELATLHDMVESLTGDSTPYASHEIPQHDSEAMKAFFSVRHPRSAERRAAKRIAEAEALEQLLHRIPETIASRIRDAVHEYEAQQTPEAQFVKQVDILEALLQSRVYLESHPDLPVDGFRQQALQEITHPALCLIRDEYLRDKQT